MLFLLFVIFKSFLQQLAALLIARQVIGNLKESALPYMLEHLRLAKMSFDMWGALSPVNPEAPKNSDTPEHQVKDGESSSNTDQASSKRSMSQAELESSLYKVIFVGNYNKNLL